MNFFNWLWGGKYKREADPQRSSAGAGADPHSNRFTTQTERDLRKVQSQYNPETESFGSGTPDSLEPGNIPGQNPQTPERMPGHTSYYEDKR